MVSDSFYDVPQPEEGTNEAPYSPYESENAAPMSEEEPSVAEESYPSYSEEESYSSPEEEVAAQGNPKKDAPARVGFSRVLAALFAVLAVGGLFLGCLGSVVGFFAPHTHNIPGQILNGSLLGYTIEAFRQTFQGALSGLPVYFKILEILELGFLAVAALSAVVSVV